MPEARNIFSKDVILDEKNLELVVDNEDGVRKFSLNTSSQVPEIKKILKDTVINFNFFMGAENVITHICKQQ